MKSSTTIFIVVLISCLSGFSLFGIMVATTQPNDDWIVDSKPEINTFSFLQIFYKSEELFPFHQSTFIINIANQSRYLSFKYNAHGQYITTHLLKDDGTWYLNASIYYPKQEYDYIIFYPSTFNENESIQLVIITENETYTSNWYQIRGKHDKSIHNPQTLFIFFEENKTIRLSSAFREVKK